MSEVAGVLSVQYAAQYLQKKYNGLGISLGHITGTTRASVVVIGAGVSGRTAAKTAVGMGSNVLLFDINDAIIEFAQKDIKDAVGDKLEKRVKVLKSEPELFQEAIKNADVVVGAVLIAGAKAPVVISEDHVKNMKKGSIIVDVAIDQGGCIWGAEPTTHSEPTYEKEGVIYCCVSNMPGQVAKQSTEALTEATLPYLLTMANNGVIKTLRTDIPFSKGVNTHNGKICYKCVAEDLDLMEYYEEFHQKVEV